MARKPTKAVSPSSDTAPAPAPSDDAGSAISKAKAARAVLADGVDNPTKAVVLIKKRFGIIMTPQHFSAVKSNEKKADVDKPSGKTIKTPVSGYLAPPKLPPKGDGDLIDVMESMKPLIAQYGADQVKRIVDLLG